MPRKRGFVRERILRVLLNHPDGSLTKYRVAKLAEGTYSWVHEFLGELETMSLIKDTRVLDYSKLVGFWKRLHVQPIRKKYALQKPLEVIKLAKLRYALTTYAAENMVQNYLFPSNVDFYIDPEDTIKWHKILSHEGLVGGGNTTVLIGDPHVFYNSFERRELTMVSIPQLVIDLLRNGAHCTEAAEMLIKKEEGPVVR